MAKQKATPPVTEESVLDVSSYNDDFAALDQQMQFVEDIYEELHGKVKAASDTSGRAGVLGGIKTGSINAQAYEVLMKMRTSAIDVVGKRTSLKLSLATLAQKNKASREDQGGDQVALAREMVRQLQQEEQVRTIRERIGRNDYGQKTTSASSMDSLESRVSQEFETGGIVLTPNENAMKYAKHIAKGDFTYVYDNEEDKIRVKLSTGEILDEKEWPEERLPQHKVVDHTETHVILENGQKIVKL